MNFSHILLAREFEAKINDFGNAIVVTNEKKEAIVLHLWKNISWLCEYIPTADGIRISRGEKHSEACCSRGGAMEEWLVSFDDVW